MPASRASLTLGHVLIGMGADCDPAVRLEDVLLIRHAFRPGDPTALRGSEDLTEELVINVGKADGAERILGRWTSYARDSHGGNVALSELANDSAAGETTKTDHARHFFFSLLRVFGPSTPSREVDSAESHYKDALMTRQFGLNRN